MPCWPRTRIWARGWASAASLSASSGSTGSRSTPVTAGTPICSANVSTAEWGNSALAQPRGGRNQAEPDPRKKLRMYAEFYAERAAHAVPFGIRAPTPRQATRLPRPSGRR